MSERVHAGCGRPVARADVVQELHAPGVWAEPGRWRRPDLLMFHCEVHGLVDWSETRFGGVEARPPVRQTQAAMYSRPKQGLFR